MKKGIIFSLVCIVSGLLLIACERDRGVFAGNDSDTYQPRPAPRAKGEAKNPLQGELLRVDMAGKTILITGSTDGVGRYVAKQLAAKGADVLIHGRDAARAQALIEEIVREGSRAPVFYQADLSSLAGARQLADAVLADHKRLDVFISNAGIGSRTQGPERPRRFCPPAPRLTPPARYLSGQRGLTTDTPDRPAGVLGMRVVGPS